MIEYKILFCGDIGFEKYAHRIDIDTVDINIVDIKGFDYPFHNFKNILCESNMVIANYESAITNRLISPFEGKKSFIIRSNPEKTVEYLKKYNILNVSLANNHTFDYGIEGLTDTISYLEKGEINFFGAGKNLNQASKPFVKNINIEEQSFKFAVFGAMGAFLDEYEKELKEDFKSLADQDKPGLCYLDKNYLSALIQDYKFKYPDYFIIFFLHWGLDYMPVTTQQKEIAYKLIDSGADLIIGNHAHQFQEIELYKGKWIFYSIGNFIFNTAGRYKDFNSRGFSGLLSLSLKYTNNNLEEIFKLYPTFTDNKRTNYQNRFVTEEEFPEVLEIIFNDSKSLQGIKDKIFTGKDNYGYFMEFPLIMS